MHRKAGLTNKGAESSKEAADRVPSKNETQKEKLQPQSNASANTTSRPADPLAALGKVMSSSGDDDETHPGLEKPFAKQQELR